MPIQFWHMNVGNFVTIISDPYDDTHYAFNYKVASIVTHEYFNLQTYANDIGMIKTVRRMVWNRGVAPACLTSKYDE